MAILLIPNREFQRQRMEIDRLMDAYHQGVKEGWLPDIPLSVNRTEDAQEAGIVNISGKGRTNRSHVNGQRKANWR